jgi:serine/threonine protein kinase
MNQLRAVSVPSDIWASIAIEKCTSLPSICFSAPEVIKNERYSYGVDWWGVGCLVYEMVEGKVCVLYLSVVVSH